MWLKFWLSFRCVDLFLGAQAPLGIANVKKKMLKKFQIAVNLLSLPSTCNHLLATWYWQPGTCYMIIATHYVFPNTCYPKLILVTPYLLKAICYSVFVTWYLFPGTFIWHMSCLMWYLLTKTCYLIVATRYFFLTLYIQYLLWGTFYTPLTTYNTSKCFWCLLS